VTAARIVSGDDVRNAVQAVLTAHLPLVLVTVGGLEMPKSHEAPTVEAAKLDAAALPILVVSVPGFADPPTRDEQGIYTGRFDCLVDFLVRSANGTYEQTAADVRKYAAAVRTVLIERPTLDGYALDVEVVDESYDDADPKVARTLAQGEVTCVVTVYDINRIGTTFTSGDATSVATSTTITVEPL
jgi:hypothetical protein